MLIIYDPEIEKNFQEIETNPDAAADLLRIAAKYILLNKQMPQELCIFLHDAFVRSMEHPRPKRGKVLARELKLVRDGRSKKKRTNTDINIGAEVNDLIIKKNYKITEAAAEIAEKYDVDESSARRYWDVWKEYDAAQKINDGDYRSN